MADLVRKGEGKPLSRAAEEAGLKAPQLAAATKEVDVRGRGIGKTTAYKLITPGPDDGETVRLRTAWLAATVLHKPLQDLFDMPSVSTDTVERSTPNGDAH